MPATEKTMHKTSDNNSVGPFTGNAEFLDLEFQFLLARALRIGAQARVREAEQLLPGRGHTTVGEGGPEVGIEETRRRHELLAKEERRIRDLIDARLEAHRAAASRDPIGLEVLALDHVLDEADKTILLLLTAAAVSQQLIWEITGHLGGQWSGPDVETTIRLLHPEGNVAAWLSARRRFHRSGALVRCGLLKVDYPSSDCGPASLLAADVSITMAAMAVITGATESLTNGDDSDPSFH